MLWESPGVTQTPTHASRHSVPAGRPHRPGRVQRSESESRAHVAQVAGCFEVRLRRAFPQSPAPPVNRSPRAQPPPCGPCSPARPRPAAARAAGSPRAPAPQPALPAPPRPRRTPRRRCRPAAASWPSTSHRRLWPSARLPLATPGLPTQTGTLEVRPPAWAPEVQEPPAPPVSRSPHPQLGGGPGGGVYEEGRVRAGPGGPRPNGGGIWWEGRGQGGAEPMEGVALSQ